LSAVPPEPDDQPIGTGAPRRSRPRLLVIEYQPSCPPGLLATAAAAVGVDLDVVAAGDQVPADLGGATGLVLLGGELAAYNDRPELAASMRLLRQAHDQAVPALGICLGAQLAAP
jgi:GMP synthase (glutamine-hydrolysing)